MADFMFLLYNQPDDFDGVSPEEMQQIVERYRAWGEKLEGEGKLVGSDKLRDEDGRVVRRQGGKTRVIDGPFSEAKEVIGGYFTVRAADYDEALEIADGCPHLDFGIIEIRQIDAMD